MPTQRSARPFARPILRPRRPPIPLSYFLCEWLPWPFPCPDGFATERGRGCARLDRIRGVTLCSEGGEVADCCGAAGMLEVGCGVCSDRGRELSLGRSLL